MSQDSFDPHYEWLGIAPDEQPANHYRLLGVRLFEPKPAVLESAADRQMAHVRTFQTGPRGRLVQQILNEIAAARVELLDPTKKAAYDARLAASLSPANPPATLALAKRLKRIRTNPAVETTKIVGGGILGLLLAALFLTYFAGIDLLGRRKDASVKPPTQVAMAKQSTKLENTTSQAETRKRAITPPRRTPPATARLPVSPPKETSPLLAPSPPSRPASDGVRRAGEVRNDNGLQLKLVWCPPGSFTMGSPANENGRLANETETPVTLTRGFWLGKYEVTQGEFRSLMNRSPWAGKPYLKEGERYPASYINWNDADEFCRKLTEQERLAERLPENESYRLPTEAEWEHACRGGSTTRFHFGDDDRQLDQYAWFAKNAINIGEQYAHPVGLKTANAYGLHDMHGNVWEYCSDWYGEKLAGGNDPAGAASGSNRVWRGGSWDFISEKCRSASRGAGAPVVDRFGSVGFRVARGADTPPTQSTATHAPPRSTAQEPVVDRPPVAVVTPPVVSARQEPVVMASKSRRDDVVAWFDFDDADANKRIAKDGSGHGHDGVIAGATRTNGKFGSALFFDGQTARLIVNGEICRTESVLRPMNACKFPLRIGNGAYDATRCFHGAIDEVLIVRRALDDGELKTVLKHGVRAWATGENAAVR